jgi:hypothetical protein
VEGNLWLRDDGAGDRQLTEEGDVGNPYPGVTAHNLPRPGGWVCTKRV